MAKFMTEIEAWKYLAKAWSSAEPSYGEYVARIGTIPRECLCLCTWQLVINGVISPHLERMMDRKIRFEKKRIGADLYLYSTNAEGAKKRAALCRRFARQLEAKKAAKQTPKKKAVPRAKVKAK